MANHFPWEFPVSTSKVGISMDKPQKNQHGTKRVFRDLPCLKSVGFSVAFRGSSWAWSCVPRAPSQRKPWRSSTCFRTRGLSRNLEMLEMPWGFSYGKLLERSNVWYGPKWVKWSQCLFFIVASRLHTFLRKCAKWGRTAAEKKYIYIHIYIHIYISIYQTNYPPIYLI